MRMIGNSGAYTSGASSLYGGDRGSRRTAGVVGVAVVAGCEALVCGVSLMIGGPWVGSMVTSGEQAV